MKSKTILIKMQAKLYMALVYVSKKKKIATLIKL